MAERERPAKATVSCSASENPNRQALMATRGLARDVTEMMVRESFQRETVVFDKNRDARIVAGVDD
ncbi:hypothetical protein CS8_071370 [Cupriavidus sp. 8B]